MKRKKLQIMKAFTRNIFSLMVLMAPSTLLQAQVKIDHLPHAPGSLIRNHNTVQFLNRFKILPASKVTSLAREAGKMMDIICQSPHLNPPVGYNAEVHVAAEDEGLKEKEPRLEVFCYLRYLTKDSRYTGIRESMDGADLYLKINDFGIFDQMGNYWQDCNKLNFPLFFEAPSLIDSTNDYIEFRYKGDPVRIVMAGNKPLYVPLTRKEFVQFLIARDQYRIKDYEKSIGEMEKNKKQNQETLANPPSYVTDDIKKALTDGIANSDKYIIQAKDAIKKIKEQTEVYHEYLNRMVPAETDAPVRLDYNKNDDGIAMGGIGQLVPVGRTEGTLLVKINPSYYNYSADAPVAQMIVMYNTLSAPEERKEPGYLEQAMRDIFNNTDYHKLKAVMQ